ncbi:MAG TPA: hypothetical protein PKK10_04675 [Woeseiaceae bacterium]|nr:hypothetical protein [Woeseiaceae bacterium]
MFGRTQQAARRYYSQFVQHKQPDELTRRLSGGSDADDGVLGDDQFVLNALNRRRTQSSADIEDLVEDACKRHKVTRDDLASKSRDRRYSRIRAEIGIAATEKNIASVTEVARLFNRSQPGLSRAMSRLRDSLI